jgi:hypothetical protein
MTIVSEPVLATPKRTTLKPLSSLLLIAAPLIMALARVLLVPFDDQEWDSTLTKMAAHQARSDTGWLLAIMASGLLATSAATLSYRLNSAGRTKSATFALVTTAVGWAGCAAIGLGGIYMSVAAHAPDRAGQVQVLKDFNDGNSGYVFLMCAIAAVGYIVLAIGLGRSRAISVGAAVLIAIGGVATLLTMAGPVKPLLVSSALALAAGHALALRSRGERDEL